MRDWRGFGWDLLDLFFPRTCMACGKPADGVGLRQLCSRCSRKVRRIGELKCRDCGHPFYGPWEESRACPHCVDLVPEYREAISLTLARGPARALIHGLKYHRRLETVRDMAFLLEENTSLRERFRGGCFVPVPLHPRKLRHRGYNQSEALAEAFAKTVGGGAIVRYLLVRKVDTKTQTAYDRSGRQGNLKNAFALAPSAVIVPALHYILVDDVFTTGSTLNSCAGVLRRHGCVNLDVLTFGHG